MSLWLKFISELKSVADAAGCDMQDLLYFPPILEECSDFKMVLYIKKGIMLSEMWKNGSMFLHLYLQKQHVDSY